VQGFLQVQSTMAMGLTHVRLSPTDLFNVCRFLARRHAKTSPRSLRFELEPDRRVRLVLEPWGHTVESASVFGGAQPATVRTWGRERLLTLAPLLPAAQSVDVYLAGFGLPSIYVLDLGGASFTLALSGWTDNDWTGGAKFDLLTRRLTSKGSELLAVYEELRRQRAASDTALASQLGMGVEKTRSALSHLCQIGRAMFDLSTGSYRHRDLFFEPFTAKEAEAAVALAVSEKTSVPRRPRDPRHRQRSRHRAAPGRDRPQDQRQREGRDGARVRPLVSVDAHGQITEAQCTAPSSRSTLTRGRAEHGSGLAYMID
jgi:hypothetical protein